MKLYISVDIEGVACVAAPAETDRTATADYAPFREQMTAEAAAACAGAFAGGAITVVVKDAHGTARNLDPHRLATPHDKAVQLIRGWSGHPFKMVQGIDRSFDAAAFVGFHSAAGSGGSPLAHTISGRMFSRIELNGEVASEFLLYGLAAASVGVPVVFLSGDRALCDDASRRITGLVTVPVLEGFGASCQSMLPDRAVRSIEDGMRRAVGGPRPAPMPMPDSFVLRVAFAKPFDAYARSFFPGVRLASDTDVVLETDRYFDVLTFLAFAAR